MIKRSNYKKRIITIDKRGDVTFISYGWLMDDGYVYMFKHNIVEEQKE